MSAPFAPDSRPLTRRAVLVGTAAACLLPAVAPLLPVSEPPETQGDLIRRMSGILSNARARTEARDDYYERFYRAWDRLSPQQQEEALLKLEAMFPEAAQVEGALSGISKEAAPC